jgi:hypothetical protein
VQILEVKENPPGGGFVGWCMMETQQQGTDMEITDFMIIKAVVLGIGAFIYGYLKGIRGEKL